MFKVIYPREREGAPIHWFTLQKPAMARVELGLKLEAVNSIQISHMEGRNPTA